MLCPRRSLTFIAATTAMLTGTSCTLTDAAPATPQRPTVSFDTSTAAAGTFELETGVQVDPGDTFDSPNTLKYGTSENTELFVGWSPIQHVSRPGEDGLGSGDVVLGARHRLWDADGELPSAAAVLSGKIPSASAADGLGSGETDLRIATVLNRQFGDVTANAFYQYGALGLPGGGTTSEHTATLTGSMALTEELGAFVELGGIFVPSASTDALFAITGATWSTSPDLVFDGGINVGLSDDAADLQLFLGCTWNFGPPLRRPQ
ncbi:MAG: transporter [bacterium]|nr:transporter [bacterium]